MAHVIGFMKENKIPAGGFVEATALKELNQQLKDKFGHSDLAMGISNYQVVLNNNLINAERKLKREEILAAIVSYFSKQEAILMAFDIQQLGTTPLQAKIKEMIVNGYFAPRGGDIQLILKPNYMETYGPTGTTHGLWNPYDAHIPLLWYGWGIKAGKTNRETYMTDIAPTVAALLHIQMPGGCIGKVISEVIK